MIPVEFTEEFNAFVEENSIDVVTQYVVAKLKSKEGKTERERERKSDDLVFIFFGLFF